MARRRGGTQCGSEQVASELTESQPFSVVTWNTFVGPPLGTYEHARFLSQAKFMQEESADVYCLQEVFSDAQLELLQQELGAEYQCLFGHSSTLVVTGCMVQGILCLIIAALLVVAGWQLTLDHVSYSSIACILGLDAALALAFRHIWQGVLWSFAFGATRAGLVVLVRKQSVQVRSYKYHPFDEQSGDFMNYFRQRGYLQCSLTVRGAPVSIVNLHANTFPTVSMRDARALPSAYRQRQLRQACEQADRVDDCEGILVLGDFNSDPKDNEIPAADHALVNAWQGDDAPGTVPLTPMLTNVFPDTDCSLSPDYIFSKGLVLLGSQVLETGDLSDHFPLKGSYKVP